MKKTFFKVSILSLLLLLCCTGCDGNVTRDIRHAGFSVGAKIACDPFFPAKKDEVAREKILYYTGSHIINTDGKIYDLSLGQTYASGQNCREATTSIRVKAIFDNSIVKATDGKYYYLHSNNNVEAYSEVPQTDNSYLIYDILLKEDDVVKVMTADNSIGAYYVLKVDGNIYENIVTAQDRNSPPKLVSTRIMYDMTDFEGRIIDFNYAGDSLATFVRTNNKVFRDKIKNFDECSKYADIECQFELQEDPIFEQYKDRIISFNGSTLITDYKMTFTVAS